MFSLKAKYKAACCLLPTGILTLSIALVMGYYIVPQKIREGIMKESKLIRGDNPRYNAFAKVPIPLYQNIYLFNVTNPAGVVMGEKPIIQQLGPYIYEMKMEKFNIAYNEGNGTFFYRERIDYFFRADLSNGTESDPITFVNLPFVAAAQEVSKYGTFASSLVRDIIDEHPELAQLYLHTTVGSILFGGIPMPFVEVLSSLNGGESVMPNNTFGIMYGQNGTDQGRFEVYSGQKHPDRFGDVVSWNGMHDFEWWSDDRYCRQFNGSNGIFKPFATKQKPYYMFMPGMCTAFPFTFEQEGPPVFDIPAYKYSIPKQFFANPTDHPENACYFKDFSEPYPLSGVFPLRGCGKGPMMLSQPHFYHASSVYLNQSVGLSPEKDKHEMSMLMEPYTGTPMLVNVRFQMNIDLYPTKSFKSLKKIPKMVHPLFWMEQISGIPEKDAGTIRNTLIFALRVISIVTRVTVFVGAGLILWSLFLFRCYGKGCNTVSNSPPKKKLLFRLFHGPRGRLFNRQGKTVQLPQQSDAEVSNKYIIVQSANLPEEETDRSEIQIPEEVPCLQNS